MCFWLASTTAITEITVNSRNATSISIAWSVESAGDADGYVVYRNTSTGLTSGVDVGNITQHTLTGLLPQQIYTISVRPYQDLLGPRSETVVRTDGELAGLFALCIFAICERRCYSAFVELVVAVKTL